jgi:hypothetical protein
MKYKAVVIFVCNFGTVGKYVPHPTTTTTTMTTTTTATAVVS